MVPLGEASMRLQFDTITFDADSRQIWVGNNEVHLSPKAFDLLALLIARRPHAVSKAEIRKHLWPDTFVSDSSLPSLVSEVREAIVDLPSGDHRGRASGDSFGDEDDWRRVGSDLRLCEDRGPP